MARARRMNKDKTLNVSQKCELILRKIVALVMLFCLVMGPALKPNPLGWFIQQCWNMRVWLAEYGVGHYDAMECDYRLYDCNVPM